jgi:hypothetical protein
MIESQFKLDFRSCHRLLKQRLDEPPPGRIQLLTGPRQVGKTTLLLRLASEMEAAKYIAADGPEAGLPGFWERTWENAERDAVAAGRGALLLDEVQHVPNWAARLKSEWDRLRRRKVPLHVVASGSSALRLGSGARESLAGRFERMTLVHWNATALSDDLGVTPDDAPELLVRFGSYPGAFPLREDYQRWRAYMRDAIVEPAIGRDLLALVAVRRPALLRQVFLLCASQPAKIVTLQKLQGQLQESGALETIAHYLGLLEEAYLVAALEKYSLRPGRRRASPPKLVVLNNALLGAVQPEGIPDRVNDPDRFGAWVENACLAHAWNMGQRVTYWREEPLEVDGVFEGSWGNWALEVKTGAVDAAGLSGLMEFCRRHRRFRPLLVTGAGGIEAAERLGIESQRWEEFLRSGPRGVSKP